MLTGKTAVVTGASRGIGRAIALKMAEQGANVALVYAQNEEAARKVCAEAQGCGVKAEAYRCDVADFEAVRQLIKTVLDDFGGLDILVNNAGIVRDTLLLSMKEEDFDAVIDTNLKGAFNLIRHACPHFIRKRAGRIINIGSVAGLMGNPGQANYAAAKAGLMGLTKTVARELASRNVTCNAIAPGFIETDMTGALPDKTKEAALHMIPMKRMGSPRDVADLAVFLAGDAAGYITGEVVKIDGGLYM